MSNGQLVEYYLPVKEVEQAKRSGNHALFEKWRDRDMEKLTQAELKKQYADQEHSYNSYQAAWDAYLSRNSQNTAAVQKILEDVQKPLQND